MLVIPVLDLQGGVVVRARGGERSAYRPIVTPLSATAQPCDVLAGLLTLSAFGTVYVADLDAISGRGLQADALRKLARAFPHVAFWLDAGLRDRGDLDNLRRCGPFRPVLGSESLADETLLQAEGAVLSLDFKDGAFLGDARLMDSGLWPGDIVVMALDAVGAARGPDLKLLRDVKARAGVRRIYSAGGVRNPADLASLANTGIHGALVATALHDGSLYPLPGLRQGTGPDNSDAARPVQSATS